MQSEKAIISAKDYGSNTELTSKLTMINNTQNTNNGQPKSRRELIEQSRLSGFSSRQPFQLPGFGNAPEKSVVVVVVCAGCNARLDTTDWMQTKFSACRKCVGIHGRVGAAAEANDQRDRRETLEKFAGGAR